MVKYYKKILVDRPWNRPNLTSNGVFGGGEFACASLTPLQASTYDIWHLFNGIDTGEDLWSSTSGQGAFVFYNPNPLKVESFEVVNYYASNNYGINWYKGSVYGSNDNVNWVKLTDYINENHYGSGEHWVIPVNSTGYYKYHKVQILENVGYTSSNRTMAREMYITATQQVSSWAECTQAEYDQLPDDDRKIVTDIYSIFSIEKYYKKISKILPWEQPIITEDGILGGNTFAVGVAPNYTESKKIYLSFQKDLPANGGGAITGTGSYRAYIIYNPTPIKITNLHIKNVNGQQTHGGTVYGSNDGATWTKIKDYTNTQFASRGEWDLDLSNNIKFYHYYKVDNGDKSIINPVNAWYLGEITITATQKIENWQECTKTEYDQLADNSRKQEQGIYAPKLNNKTYLCKRSNELEKITIEKPFIRPNLTSNGVLGGDSFAVSCDSGNGIDGNTVVSNAYQATDGNRNTYFLMWATTASTVQSYYIYNPNPLRVKNIKIVNFYTNQYAIWRAIDGNFKGSNDGSNWEVISTFSNNNGATLTINGNLNKIYKYLAIEITKRSEVAASKMLGINEIQIDATELITTIVRK